MDTLPPPPINPPPSTRYMLVRFYRDDAVSCGLMPAMIKRIEKFCETYDTDTAPHEQEELVWGLFGRRDPQLGLWGVVNADYDIVGHLLATPEPLIITPIPNPAPYRYTLIRQVEVDKGIRVGSIPYQAFREIRQWSEQLGIHRIIGLTHRNWEPLARRWGLSKYKTLVETIF